jgi:hypothetical protein
MGFLSALGALAGIGAAPFTGGASLVPTILGTAGQVAGGIAGGRAQGRASEAELLTARDRAAVDRYQAEQNAKLQAAQLAEDIERDRATRALTSGQTRAGQAALGDILANIKSSQVSGLPGYIPKISFSGGLTPELLGPLARTSGQTLARDALMAQLTGSDVPATPDLSALGTAAPELSNLPKAGGLDTFLNTIGTIGAIAQGAGSIADEARRRRGVKFASKVPEVLKSAKLEPVSYPKG